MLGESCCRDSRAGGQHAPSSSQFTRQGTGVPRRSGLRAGRSCRFDSASRRVRSDRVPEAGLPRVRPASRDASTHPAGDGRVLASRRATAATRVRRGLGSTAGLVARIAHFHRARAGGFAVSSKDNHQGHGKRATLLVGCILSISRLRVGCLVRLRAGRRQQAWPRDRSPVDIPASLWRRAALRPLRRPGRGPDGGPTLRALRSPRMGTETRRRCCAAPSAALPCAGPPCAVPASTCGGTTAAGMFRARRQAGTSPAHRISARASSRRPSCAREVATNLRAVFACGANANARRPARMDSS